MNNLLEKLPLPYQGIPSNWSTCYISDIAKIGTGDSDTQDKVEGGSYPFFVRSQTIEKTNKYTFDGKAILTAGDGVGVGKVFHLVEGKFALHQRVYRISNFHPKVHAEFLFEYFRKNFIRQVVKFTAKTSVDSVRMDMIAKMVVPLPPLPEQQKIANVLSTWDKAISITERLIDNSTQQKKALMQQLLTGKKRLLDESGKRFEGEWEEKTLNEVSKITRLAGAEYSDVWEINPSGEIIALRGYNIGNNTVNLRDVERITTEMSEKLSRSKLYKNDIVFPCVGSIGKAYLVQENDKFHINQNIAKITPNELVDSLYLTYCLLSNDCVRQILMFNTSSSQPNVLVGNLRKFQFTLPSFIAEQQKIATVLTTADKEIELLEQQLADLQQEKKALMQVLLTGKKRVLVDE